MTELLTCKVTTVGASKWEKGWIRVCMDAWAGIGTHAWISPDAGASYEWL